MTEPPDPQPLLGARRESDAGAVFVLQSKGQTPALPTGRLINCIFEIPICIFTWCVCKYRAVVACGVPSDDVDSGTHNTDAAVRVQRAGVGAGVPVPDHHGPGHLLLLLPHVEGARLL